MILNVRLHLLCRTEHCLVFYLIHAKVGKDDDVLFPFLKNGEKKKMHLCFRGCSAENSTQDIFHLSLSYIYTDSLYVAIPFCVWKLTQFD